MRFWQILAKLFVLAKSLAFFYFRESFRKNMFKSLLANIFILF
jgi:hypothetical protein